MDRLEAMSAFVSVAELRGFAAAARRLKLSPSGVTRLIGALEAHLETRLLQRTTRSVTLTDAGQRYLERARRILGDVAEAEEAAQSERSTPRGRFVVSAPNVFGRLHVAPLMCAYLEEYPAVVGELILADRRSNLVDEGIDAAIRIGVLEDSSHIARVLGATRRVLVASPKYLSGHKRLREPEQLSDHSVIHFTALHPLPEWRFFHNGTERRVPLRPRYVTNSADAAIGHAERGGGVTIVLAYQVTEAVRAGRLTVLLEKFEPAALPIHVLYPSTRMLSAKVRTFVELVQSTCSWQFRDL